MLLRLFRAQWRLFLVAVFTPFRLRPTDFGLPLRLPLALADTFVELARTVFFPHAALASFRVLAGLLETTLP